MNISITFIGKDKEQHGLHLKNVQHINSDGGSDWMEFKCQDYTTYMRKDSVRKIVLRQV